MVHDVPHYAELLSQSRPGQSSHHLPHQTDSLRQVPQAMQPIRDKTECQNCHTTTTPLWRRDESGQVLCNACGLFLKLHGRRRPISLKTDVIKSRNRSRSSSGHIRKKPTSSHPVHISPSLQGLSPNLTGSISVNGSPYLLPNGGSSSAHGPVDHLSPVLHASHSAALLPIKNAMSLSPNPGQGHGDQFERLSAPTTPKVDSLTNDNHNHLHNSGKHAMHPQTLRPLFPSSLFNSPTLAPLVTNGNIRNAVSASNSPATGPHHLPPVPHLPSLSSLASLSAHSQPSHNRAILTPQSRPQSPPVRPKQETEHSDGQQSKHSSHLPPRLQSEPDDIQALKARIAQLENSEATARRAEADARHAEEMARKAESEIRVSESQLRAQITQLQAELHELRRVGSAEPPSRHNRDVKDETRETLAQTEAPPQAPSSIAQRMRVSELL